MTIHGEKLSADEAIEFCFDFQSLLEEKKYLLHFVFNAVETGINWKSFPDKTLACEYETACPELKSLRGWMEKFFGLVYKLFYTINLANGWNKLLARSDCNSEKIFNHDSTLTLEAFSQMVMEVQGYEVTKISSTAEWLTEDQYDPDWEQLTGDEIIQQVLGHVKTPGSNEKSLPQNKTAISAAKVLGALRIVCSWCENHQAFRSDDINFLERWKSFTKAAEAESHVTC